ncbi:patched family-domain-containing protein [Flagelloscypha sp. PMI_526]|nr:patched family-domain-containing protein [Flagelloscypha sp. PMI_526]
MSNSTTLVNGQCAMRGSCGPAVMFGKDLPCPYDGPAIEPDNRELLVSVCGPDFATGPTCCTSSQLETLNDNLQQAEAIISSCPACRNNFRKFFCSFTCSPTQASFLNITATRTSTSGKEAIKSVDFFVGTEYGEGFFDSCKDVKMGAANTYAMDLIGGSAKNYQGFFEFLGEEKALGSPFQIDFPSSAPDHLSPFNPTPRNCADNDLSSRCTCVDCPTVCPALPELQPPDGGPTCHVGLVSCLTFILILAYAFAAVAFAAGYIVQQTIRARREKVYERLALSVDTASLSSPRQHTRGLVGAGSLAQHLEEESLGGQSQSERNLGRGASLLDPMETIQPRQHKLNNFLRRAFYKLGLFCASKPWLVFAMVFAVFGLLNVGWKMFEVETDPVRLWVAPDSTSRLQKEYFDENFGPFYRPQQIFVTSAKERTQTSTSIHSVLSWESLQYWAQVEQDIRDLVSEPGQYTLDDVCFKPSGPDGACVVQSVMGWFKDSLDGYDQDSWASHLTRCATSPVDCLPPFQQPLGPQYVLGGVPLGEDGKKDYLGAEALVINYVVSDSLDPDVQARAMEWESSLREYLLGLAERAEVEAGLHIAFSTGVSLEEEINKSTNTDVKIVVLSYLAMFVYVSLTLGSGATAGDEEGVGASLVRWARNFPRLFKRDGRLTSSSLTFDERDTPHVFPRLPRSLFVGSKVTLGFFGIFLVVLSVSTSVGFFSLVGVKVTLIIAEVIPFLVLAVGVDNVFILVHELDRQNMLHGPNAAHTIIHSIEPTAVGNNGHNATTPMSPTTSHRSPFGSIPEDVDAASMPLYFSAEERVARAVAKIGPSILLSSITETVAFALGAIVPMPAVRNFAAYAAGSVFLNAVLQMTVFVSALLIDLKRNEANRLDCFPCIRLPAKISLSDGPSVGPGTLAKFFRRHYAPFLLKPLVKGIVALIFLGILTLSVVSIQHLELGLDQRLALPSDSYLVDYFDNLEVYLDVGPPVYFVSKNINVTSLEGQQALCGRFSTCDPLSLSSTLEAERARPEVSFIDQPTASWIDDFLRWLNPIFEDCCRVRKNDPSTFCLDGERKGRCRPCFEGREPAWNVTMEGLPQDEEFMFYLTQWLKSPTNQDCPLAGQASFGAALSLDSNKTKVIASHFRTFHSPLRTQADFINSFHAAHRIADDISQETGSEVFPYSLHYVFFDQYAHIVAITQEILGLGLGSVLLVTALMLGSWRTGIVITICVALTVVNVMGVMAAWGINLNAISLVNLVISLGIAVEFCAHVARAFMSAPVGNGGGAGGAVVPDHASEQKERDERMWSALVDVGPSVLSGITFTKLIGMCVMALTRSRLLEIYYFRMWLTLIISGALHGLVLLPVILSLAGGPGYPQQEADEEWIGTAMQNDYTPFLADDDSFMSE